MITASIILRSWHHGDPIMKLNILHLEIVIVYAEVWGLGGIIVGAMLLSVKLDLVHFINNQNPSTTRYIRIPDRHVASYLILIDIHPI